MKNSFNLKQDSVRIRQINISFLYSEYIKEKGTNRSFWDIPEAQVSSYYSEIMRPSLELMHLREIAPGCFMSRGKEQDMVWYTDAFISLKLKGLFDDPKGGVLLERLYSEGFNIVTEKGKVLHYVEYKRSAGNAKKGNHLFILEKYYKKMIDWTWMGKAFRKKEMCNLTDAKAYETLVASNLIGTITLDPKHILLLDDIEHDFLSPLYSANVGLEEGQVYVNRVYGDRVTNNVFDGECLVDESVFIENECEDKGMMLLRNFFFKSCGFNTKIQKYYKHYFAQMYPGGDYDSFLLNDCLGNRVYAKDVRLIITRSSLKALKFSEHYGGDAAVYEQWKQAIIENGNLFGVVKHEHSPRARRSFTYQMLNSIPFDRKDIYNMVYPEINYVGELRTDIDSYIRYVGGKDEEKPVDLSSTDAFVMTMYNMNPDFAKTDMFKQKRYRDIDAYVDKLKRGKIKIDADYFTLCSMPFELLRHSLGEKIEGSVLSPFQIYKAGLREGKVCLLCRNPHICTSNVHAGQSAKPSELIEWFNFGDDKNPRNILVVSPWQNDLMNTLNGADFDSDEVLCIRDSSINRRWKDIFADNKAEYPVPHLAFSGHSHPKCTYKDMSRLIELDKQISTNNIGAIVNLSQILLSKYFEQKDEALYDKILILSILSGIEIDKAKHEFDLDVTSILKDIKKQEEYMIVSLQESSDWEGHIASEEIVDYEVKTGKPQFFSNITNSEGKEIWRFECPMDWANSCIETMYKGMIADTRDYTETVDVRDFFKFDREKSDGNSDSRRVNNLLETLEEYSTLIVHARSKKRNIDWEEIYNEKVQLEEDALIALKKGNPKVNNADMKEMLSVIIGVKTPKTKKPLSTIRHKRLIALSLLHRCWPEIFEGCIKTKNI